MSSIRFVGLALLAGLLLGNAGPARAQEPDSRAAEVAAEQERKAQALTPYHPGWFERKLLEIEQAGGFGAARGFVVASGDIKRGTGPSLGPAYGHVFKSGVVFNAKTVYSITNAKVAQVSLQTPHFFKRRLTIGTRVRWQDVPNVVFHGLAPGVAPVRAWYSETQSEVSADAAFRPVRAARGSERGRACSAFDTGVSDKTGLSGIGLFAGVPGVGADPDYLHSFASAAIDSRDADGYTRHGSLLRATIHDFRQQNTGPYSFRRLDGVGGAVPADPVRQLGVLSSGCGRPRRRLTAAQSVPYFLMPDLGGPLPPRVRHLPVSSTSTRSPSPPSTGGTRRNSSTPPFSTMPARLCPSGREISTSLASTSRTAPASACTDRARQCSGSKWRKAARARVSSSHSVRWEVSRAMRRLVHAFDRCHAGTRDRACRGGSVRPARGAACANRHRGSLPTTR